MSDTRYFAKPGINVGGLVPPDAERMTREQLEERLAGLIEEGKANAKSEAPQHQDDSPICYELILTPGEVGAIKAAMDDAAEAHNLSNKPFDVVNYNSAYSKIAALLDYVKAANAAENAEAAYRATLENVRDAYKVEAF